MVLWVFGYGSLIWKVGFEYDRRIIGYIKGFKRVFWQGSTSHRGTPDFPGRTVTLHPEDGHVTWGAAYCVDRTPEEEAAVLAYLEVREQNYDVRSMVDVYTAASQDVPEARGVLVYIASEDPVSNPLFLGAADLTEIARQIATAVGPSGPNYEYLFGVEAALQEFGEVDEEVTEIANKVRQLLKMKADNS